MDLTIVTLLSFAGLATTLAAGGMLLRDLVFGGRVERPTVLRRLPLVREATAPRGPVGRLDLAFQRFVQETGLDTTPWVTLSILLCSGLAVGGAAFLYADDPLIGGVAFLVGFGLPVPYLMIRRSQYLRLIGEQLPELLELIARALRAGESLDQAVELAGEKGSEPLAKEFRRCAHHLKMGLGLPAAMRSLMSRVPLLDVRIFATTLSVHRQTGGNLATTLERLSAVIRERAVFRRQIKAVTAAGRFSAALISAIGPLLFAYMFFFQREYAEKMISLPLGQTLLAVAVVLEIIGLMWIARMMRTIE